LESLNNSRVLDQIEWIIGDLLIVLSISSYMANSDIWNEETQRVQDS